MHQLRQRNQVGNPKKTPTGSQDYKRIEGTEARERHGNRRFAPDRIPKVHSVFRQATTPSERLKLLPIQWVMWMRYSKLLRIIPSIGCS